MARHGGTLQMKRLAAPRAVKVARKAAIWLAKPLPGPHPAHASITVLALLRDVLHIAKNRREVHALLREGKVFRDGVAIKQPRLPLGAMDLISIPGLGRAWRLLMKGRALIAQETSPGACHKLCRVNGKRTMGGVIALTLHDGRTILTDRRDIAVGDVLKIAPPSQEILALYRPEPGARCYITCGKYCGEIATLVEVSQRRGFAVARLDLNGEVITTLKKYIFPIGDERLFE